MLHYSRLAPLPDGPCPDLCHTPERTHAVTEWYAVWNANRRLCAAQGHTYEATGSYAGPEGAADDFTCSRCGQGVHHVYF